MGTAFKKSTKMGALLNAIGGTAINTGMGLLLEQHNDARQIHQQQELQNLQIQGQKEMADYNYQKQIDMWNATNYEAQKQHMEAAGLNPALMYGMGGGGGVTTGGGYSAGVSGAEAPKGGHEVLDSAAMGLQLQAVQAQIELAKSQANKNNVEAEKTAGVDTTKTQTEIQSLTQGIQNQKANEVLTRIQSKLEQQTYDFQGASFADRLDIITQQARMYTGQASQALIEANVQEATKQTKIDTIKAGYVAQVLENALIEVKTKAEGQSITESQARTELDKQQIFESAQRILQNWAHVNQTNAQIFLQQEMQKYITQPSWNKVWNSLETSVGTAIGNISGAAAKNNF